MQPIKTLRSTRHFLPHPVPRSTIEDIIDTARWTGSARNRQPWRFFAVTTDALRIAAEQVRPLCGPSRRRAVDPRIALSADNGFTDTEFDTGRICQSLRSAAHDRSLGTCVTTFHPSDNVTRPVALLDIQPGRLPHAIAIGCRDPHRHRSPSAIPTGRLPGSTLLTWV